MTTRFPILPSLLCVALLAGGTAGADAADAAPDASANPLRAGIRHPAPAYVAGAKFRTAEGIEGALAEQAAQRVGKPLAIVPMVPADGELDGAPASLLARRAVDMVVAPVPPGDPLRRAGVLVPTGYVASPMAIMRSDTDIKSWTQLKGRTVCMAEGGRYVGAIAARYGAIEKILRAPADSLLALRTGKCDAAVHDSVMLDALLRLPEWKKYSAALRSDAGAPLAFVVPSGDRRLASALQAMADEWSRSGYLDRLRTKRANNIAFEVYLDQDVPDCH